MKIESGKALKSLAKDVASLLRERRQGTAIRLRKPPRLRLYTSDTDGWCVSIGAINPGKSTLDIWLDRFPGHRDRKIWYGFYSMTPEPIDRFAKYGLKCVGEPNQLRDEDVIEVAYNKGRLREQLKKMQFGRPFIERYKEARTYFYGVYDYGGMPRTLKERNRLMERAAEFFETIARSLPQASPSTEDRQIYPAVENRKVVTTHVRRERNGHLPTLRKQLDNFICQVCGMRFEDFYGPLGRDFAEAHHIIPLSKLNKVITMCIDDLITVCANCHRMLHRLEGKPSDVPSLKKAIKLRRNTR